MGRQDYETETMIAHALRGEGFDASEDGTGRGTPIIAFSSKDHGADAGEISPTLRSMGHADSHPNGGGQVAIAFKPGQSEAAGGFFPTIEFAPTLQAQNNGSTAVPAVSMGWAVRRLTPTECCRLQGFPDDYLSQVTYRGKRPADGPMYKALGNSMAVNCMRVLGERIQMVETQYGAH
jgi:DNA (cytosine-5)-methyltransferase 1